jgi:hypothetical protein
MSTPPIQNGMRHATGASGIPLSWVPPGEIIRRLQATKSAADREHVLLEERATILDACAATIDDCSAPEIADSRILIGKAVAAVAAGHDEAGMALAVGVGEGLAHWAVEPRVKALSSSSEHDQWRAQWEDKRRSRYRRVDLVAKPAKDVEPWDFIHQVLIAPVGHFFTKFSAKRPGANGYVQARRRPFAVYRPLDAAQRAEGGNARFRNPARPAGLG